MVAVPCDVEVGDPICFWIASFISFPQPRCSRILYPESCTSRAHFSLTAVRIRANGNSYQIQLDHFVPTNEDQRRICGVGQPGQAGRYLRLYRGNTIVSVLVAFFGIRQCGYPRLMNEGCAASAAPADPPTFQAHCLIDPYLPATILERVLTRHGDSCSLRYLGDSGW